MTTDNLGCLVGLFVSFTTKMFERHLFCVFWFKKRAMLMVAFVLSFNFKEGFTGIILFNGPALGCRQNMCHDFHFIDGVTDSGRLCDLARTP